MLQAHTNTGGHVLGNRFLVGVWAALMACTVLTVAVARVDLGFLNVAVAMAVATVKALLVILFFMHLRFENSLLRWMVFIAFVILAICIGFTFFDLAWRP